MKNHFLTDDRPIDENIGEEWKKIILTFILSKN